MLGIVEYGAGNQTSVLRALGYLGVEARISEDPAWLGRCDGLIFPGVGAAPQAMERIEASGIGAVLKRAVANGQPLLGICLGCQILLEKSAEGSTQTLGLVQGECIRFNPDLREDDGAQIRIPHMGWNKIVAKKPSPLLSGLDGSEEFYFVHGYYVRPAPELVIAETRYGLDFCSVYGRDGLWAVQFHPEKSGRPGLKILSNFHAWCRDKANAV